MHAGWTVMHPRAAGAAALLTQDRGKKLWPAAQIVPALRAVQAVDLLHEVRVRGAHQLLRDSEALWSRRATCLKRVCVARGLEGAQAVVHDHAQIAVVHGVGRAQLAGVRLFGNHDSLD